MIALAFLHIMFPRYFEWKKELASLSIINRQMMYVHAFFIALGVLLMGLLCLLTSYDIIHTSLGGKLSLGLFIFWTARAFFQFFIYSSKLWRGKRLETTAHLIFSLFWIYFSVVFFIVYWNNHTT